MTLLVTRPHRQPLTSMFPAVAAGVPADVEETDDAFLIDLDLPSANAEDVRIDLRNNEISVAGRFRERQRTGLLRHQARRTGEFEYIISLPGDVDADGVQADLDSGVLSIRAPKARGEKARRIEVQTRRQIAGETAGTPAAQAKQMKEGKAPPSASSTGQVGRSSTA